MKDLTVNLQDRAGAAADIFEALGRAGINVEGACGLVTDGKAVVHLCVEDGEAAQRALQGANVHVSDEHEAIITAVEDTPGSAGRLFRRIAEAGVNLTCVYLATNTRVVICADDIEAARAQLQAGVGAPDTHT